MKEVKTLRMLEHENVVKLNEIRKVEDELFLVFEYLETNLFRFYSEFKNAVSDFPESVVGG